MMRSAIRFIAPLSAALIAISGCGGGNSDPKPTPLQTETATVAAAAAVPSAAASAVRQVSTSVGVGTLASSMKAPADPRVSNDLTLALNDANQIVLATSEVASGGRIELSARSTAIALIRLARAAATPASTIEAAAAFPALEGAVQSALERGVAPASDRATLQSVMAVLQQMPKQMSNARSSSQRKQTLALPPERVELTPTTIMSKGPLAGKVTVTSGSLQLVSGDNETRLFWSMSANGQTLEVKPSSGYAIRANGGSPFALTIAQTSQTRRLNATETLRVVAKALLGFLSDEASEIAQCGATVGGILLNNEQLTQALDAPSAEAWLNYFNKFPDYMSEVDVANMYLECYSAGKPESFAYIAKRFVASIAFLTRLKELELLVDSATALQTFGQMVNYWSENKPVGVCQDKTGAIKSCAVEFDIDEPLVLIPGASKTPVYRAYDASGDETGMAASVTFGSTDTNTLLVNPPDGRVSGFNPGSAFIRVVEPVDEKSSRIPIRVVIPRIEPQLVRTSMNAGIKLDLIDPQGGKLVTDGASVTWTIDKPNIARIDQQGSGAALLTALADGEATVTATLATTGTTITSIIQVGGTVYEGQASLTGPATTAGSCPGTYQIYGTMTVDTGVNPTMRIVGKEQIAQPCYNQLIDTSVFLQLTGSAGHFLGKATYPFTCPPPCFSGQVVVSADLGIETILGQSPHLRGTVTVVNANQSGFRGEATGNIDIVVKFP